MDIIVRPIGFVTAGRAEAHDDGWDDVRSTIALTERLGTESLRGLDAFSHVEVVFHFHLVDDDAVVLGARHPRERADWPAVGIFAQRGRVRPNRLAVTACRLVEVRDTQLDVVGLDAVIGSPVVDLKPVMAGFLPRGERRQPAWATEIMSAYW